MKNVRKKKSHPKHARAHPSSRVLKRTGLVMLSAVFVLVFAVAGYCLWYSQELNSALSMDGEQESSIDSALTSSASGEPFYVLVLGSDSREGSGTSTNPTNMGNNQRSDVMILIRVDSSNKQLTMVSIPRDTPYRLADGTIAKINEAYNQEGAAASIKAVSELTGVPISHYAEVHFSEFQAVVDKLGGVTVDVPIELSYKDALTGETITLEPGMQHLNGQQAQIFVRARHEYGSNQDGNRQNNVRTLMTAMIRQVLEKPAYEIPNTILDLATCVGTDMKTDDIVLLGFELINGSGDTRIYSTTGPTDGDINENAGGQWLCYENPEGWASLMEVVDAGDDPKDVDISSTAIGPATVSSKTIVSAE